MSKPMIRLHTLRRLEELRIKAEDATFENMKTRQGWASVTLLCDINDKSGRRVTTENRGSNGVNTCECFGKEMIPNYEYYIQPGSRLAYFTYGGCTLQVKGQLTQEYEATNNSMKEYLNLANILHNRRQLAAIQRTIGPKILVIGAGSSGKSSICNILGNYATKMNWNPIYVELDTRSSTDKDCIQFLPGIIGCCVLDYKHEHEPLEPLIFHYGRTEINEETDLYKHLCESLATAIHLRLAHNLKETKGQIRKEGHNENEIKLIASSGIIVNGPNMASIELIKEIIDIFNIDLVAVVDDPSLKHNLTQIYNYLQYDDNSQSNIEKSKVNVIALSKSDGAVVVDNNRIRFIKRLHWKNYFQGTIEFPIKPQNLRILYSDYTFLTYEAAATLPISALPADYVAEERESSNISRWQNSPRLLLNAVLSVAGTDEIDFVSKSNIACFLHVRSVEKLVDENVDESINEAEDNYILELWSPEITTGKLFSHIILVPSDLNQLKWQADSF